MLARQAHARPAPEILLQTRGHTHGPITRLMSPSDLGEVVKPFVFLDLAVFDGRTAPMPMELGWHPHSGIATVTVMLEGAVHFAETTGRDGVLPAGGVEWMRAGNGVWHTGAPEPGPTRAFQLWVALPPELENGAFASQYLLPEDVPADGPARVILGAYGGAKSLIDAPPMTVLHVQLEAGESWTFDRPERHTVAWIAVDHGALHTPSLVPEGQMAVFGPSDERITFVAERDTGFVLGSAAEHAHALVLGNYSVHTSAEALARGETEIRRIGRQLRIDGVLGRARQLG